MNRNSGGTPQGKVTTPHQTAFFCKFVALNVAVISFYALWSIADNVTVNRAEEHGFDPNQLLPHATPFWFAPHASLLSILTLDLLAFLAWRRSRSQATQQPDVLSGPPPHEHVARQ